MLPANVTLDTADATPTPANYTITFDSASATAAITMADGAVLEGFTLQSATGNAAASTISCSAGAVTVRSCVLAGATSGSAATKPATGIAVGTASTDTCTGTLNNLTIRNFKTAVSVHTASATAVTITDSTLRDSGIGTTAGGGLVMATGKVTATRLTINKSTTGTASWGVYMDSASATTGPSLTATDLTIAGVAKAGLHLQATTGMAEPAATLTGGDIVAGSAPDAGIQIAQGGRCRSPAPTSTDAAATACSSSEAWRWWGPAASWRTTAGTACVSSAARCSWAPRPAAPSASPATACGALGLWTAGNVTASLKNAAIHDNHDTGVLDPAGRHLHHQHHHRGRRHLRQQHLGGKAVGGIFFATPSTLTSFTGNKVHGNTGNEIGFDAQPNGGDTWDLSGPVGCGSPNQIYCYTAAGSINVGLRILDTAPMNTKVNVAGTSWTNLVPTKGPDFDFDMLKHDVTALPACAAVTTTCN